MHNIDYSLRHLQWRITVPSMGNRNYAPDLIDLDPDRESQILLDDSTRPILDNVRKDATPNWYSSSRRLEGVWSKYSLFASLIITTVISSLLLASSIARWTKSGRFYHTVVSNRASTQLVVQLISHLLGLIQVTAICRIINYSTRLRMEQNPVSLDMIHL